MTEVSREALEARARERAHVHAASSEGARSDPDGPTHQALGVVACIFDAVGVGHHTNPVPLAVWAHRRDTQQHEEDWHTLLVRRLDLIEAAEHYLATPWMSNRETDWVVLNLLVYAEFQGYLDHLKKKRMSGFRYAIEKDRDPTAMRWFTAGSVVWFLTKWALWLGVLAVSPSDGFRLGLVAATILWQGWNWWERRKQNRILAAMLRVYSHLNTVSLSWRVVWEELSRARAAGVVWDGVVYRLVEMRLAEPIAATGGTKA